MHTNFQFFTVLKMHTDIHIW